MSDNKKKEEQDEEYFLHTIQRMKIHRKCLRDDKLLGVIQAIQLDHIPKCHKCKGLLSYQMIQKRSMDEGMTPV